MTRRRDKVVREAIAATNALRRELDKATLAELRAIRKIAASRGLGDAILAANVRLLRAEAEEELALRKRRPREIKRIERELAESLERPILKRGRR